MGEEELLLDAVQVTGEKPWFAQVLLFNTRMKFKLDTSCHLGSPPYQSYSKEEQLKYRRDWMVCYAKSMISSYLVAISINIKLIAALDWIEKAGVTLKPAMCVFSRQQIQFIDQNGVRPDISHPNDSQMQSGVQNASISGYD